MFVFTETPDAQWKLLVIIGRRHTQFIKTVRTQLKVAAMCWAGGTIYELRRPGVRQALFGSSQGLIGKLIVPDWCDVGEHRAIVEPSIK